MGISIDLRKAYKARQHGQITAVYTWMRLPGEAEPERVMILLATYRSAKSPWFIIREPMAHEYGHSDEELMLAAIRCCSVLDIEPSKTVAARIASIILEGLPDLIEMPSAPDPEKSSNSMGQVQVKIDGQTVNAEDVRPENEGVTYG